ncbi:uncharacterized protein LOC129215132 isoform X4 [Grus americana]|uniref:uncharacterized protein LOC129215132 isoform X4 n=1 Tax=Grus americana TaxID=9117 RepID=UPI002407F37D|nr:uncharacterized protein LOC129215132 isoform X4 [Grus americana]
MAAKGPRRSLRGRRARERGGGGGRGSSAAADLRQILESGSRWGAPRPPLRAQPRNAAQHRRGGRRERGPAESCGRRRGPEWRPPARVLGSCTNHWGIWGSQHGHAASMPKPVALKHLLSQFCSTGRLLSRRVFHGYLDRGSTK